MVSFLYLQLLLLFSKFNLPTVIFMLVVCFRLVLYVCSYAHAYVCLYVKVCVHISQTVVQVIEHKCILKFKAGRLHIFSTLEFKWHLLHSLFVCENKTSNYSISLNNL